MLNSPIDEIKARLDIVTVIGSYIKLSKAGANFRAVCPFHSEKKPSFFVSPAKQIWHCFGCGLGGGIFDFVMRIEGVEFGDALKILAQKAGVELKPISKELKTERSRLYEICELATRFFEKQLYESKAGKEAKEYLLKRGISEESIKKWRLGYSPDTWQGLANFLTFRNYKQEEIEKAGLALTNERGSFYDRFRGRIIFPIFDLNSQVIGFGARVFKEKDKTEIAKYINTPNTLLYDKSRVLYGLDKNKVGIRKKNECILVEGYTDVILLTQAGFENVIAASGTSLTPYQLKIIKRYTENLIISFDMDLAGESATKRGIELAQSLEFNIKVLSLPTGADPADVVAENPAHFEKILKEKKSIVEFYFDNAFDQFDKDKIEGKKEISKILLPVIKRIPNEIEKSFWINELAKRAELKEEAILAELKKVKIEEEILGLEAEEIVNLPSKSRKDLLEERIATLILKDKKNLDVINKEDLDFFSPSIVKVIELFQKNLDMSDLDSELKNLVSYLSIKAEIEEEIDSKEELKNCLKEFRCLRIKEKLDKISKDIKKAESEKNTKEVEKLFQEFNNCSRLLNNIEKEYEEKNN